MSVVTMQDQIAITSSGQQVRDIPNLRTIPLGYYLDRNGEVALRKADPLYIPFYTARGNEFLCYEKDMTLHDAEACVYLRAIGGIQIDEPVKKVRKTRKRKKNLKKGGNL